MYIVLLRHGEAENHSALGPDSERQLTERGRHDVCVSADRLQQFFISEGVGVAKIVHSPFVRTTQTAQLVKERLTKISNGEGSAADIELSIEPQLIPDSVPQRALEVLRRHASSAGTNVVVAVTHQPLISSLLNGYTHGEFALHRSATIMLPGSLVVLSGEVLELGCCQLALQVHPYDENS